MLKLYCFLFGYIVAAYAQSTIDMFTNRSNTQTLVPMNIQQTNGVVFAAKCANGAQLRTSNSTTTMNYGGGYWFLFTNHSPYYMSIGRVVSMLVTNFSFTQVGDSAYNWYWITWLNGQLSVGLGKDIGLNYILQYKDMYGPFPINSLFISSSENNPCYFKFIDQTISASQVATATANPSYLQMPQTYTGPTNATCENGQYPGSSIYVVNGASPVDIGVDLSNTRTISFTITACTNIWPQIFLYDGSTNNPTSGYLIYTQASIAFWQIFKPVSTIRIQQYYYNLRPCNESVAYWVSWDNGRIAAGYGYSSGVNTIIAWDDPNPSTINKMAVASSSSGIGNYFLGIPNYWNLSC